MQRLARRDDLHPGLTRQFGDRFSGILCGNINGLWLSPGAVGANQGQTCSAAMQRGFRKSPDHQLPLFNMPPEVVLWVLTNESSKSLLVPSHFSGPTWRLRSAAQADFAIGHFHMEIERDRGGAGETDRIVGYKQAGNGLALKFGG